MNTYFKGTFLGSGAARYIGLGFIPRKVHIWNVEAAAMGQLWWDRDMTRHSRMYEGQYDTGAAVTALTAGTGIIRYYGGDIITAQAATHLKPAASMDTYAGDMRGKGSAGLISNWVLDTLANRTGHFDVALNTTYVGIGSLVQIGGKEYAIVALSNDGDAADDVTLNEAAPSGECDRIDYLYDLAQAEVGERMPPGIYLAETANVNATNETCFIEAWA
jgi:hypothetical protein